MLVERNCLWILISTTERCDVMALVSECLQLIVLGIGDDDSTLVVDAHPLRKVELAWPSSTLRAEHEQERAIDQRQYLHSMIA